MAKSEFLFKISPGMTLVLDSCNLTIMESDYPIDAEGHNLIAVNPNLNKCTPLHILLNKDITINQNCYCSKLLAIKKGNNIIWQPTLKLTLQNIADKFEVPVENIMIVEG